MDSWVPVVNFVYWIRVAKMNDVGFQKSVEVDLRLLVAFTLVISSTVTKTG